ncbi:hypothetical protein PG984_012795 [Apiospora sp. TS-2023a]
MVLGLSEEAAKPYIVVLASQDQCKRIRKFFKKSTVQSIYQPPDPTLPCFEFLTYGRPPEKKSGEGEMEVLVPLSGKDPSTLPFTYCGTPILVRHSSGDEIRATLGGIIRVDNENGEFQLYGLTAGHVMQDDAGEVSLTSIDHGLSEESWSDSDSGSDLESDTETDCSNDMIMNADLLVVSKPVEQLPYQERHKDPWSSTSSRKLGSIRRFTVEASNEIEKGPIDGRKLNLDWALIELDHYAPNLLPSLSKTGDVLSLELRLPGPGARHGKGGKGVRALMISGSEGPKAGYISALPSRLLLNPGTGFVDAMIINLDEYKGLPSPPMLTSSFRPVLMHLQRLLMGIQGPGLSMSTRLKFTATLSLLMPSEVATLFPSRTQ